MKYVIAALYKFVKLKDYKSLRSPLIEEMTKLNIKGTILLAEEGINGTICGERKSIDKILEYLKSDQSLTDLSHKESFSDKQAFYRTKVKLKKEIVPMGVEGIDPSQQAGEYISAEKWNELLEDPDLILLDTRNDYEVAIGTFEGAINPDIKSFRDFPEWIKKNLDPEKNKKIAMFCTGGIRCEKSTSLLNNYGFDNVYHLEGGILKYFEKIKTEESKWNGECFVFDQRVSVNQELESGNYDQCYACRMPVTEEEKKSPLYVEGVSCHHCAEKTSDESKIRFAERSKQVKLAKSRNKKHIG